MSETHTPGALAVSGPGRPTSDNPEGGDFALLDSTGQIVGEFFRRVAEAGEGLRPAYQNARRAAAAWNYVAGLETELIEQLPALPGVLTAYQHVKQQRDALLRSLRLAEEALDMVDVNQRVKEGADRKEWPHVLVIEQVRCALIDARKTARGLV